MKLEVYHQSKCDATFTYGGTGGLEQIEVGPTVTSTGLYCKLIHLYK